jgi:light-regulated signal transduction histidine kinase (bacteriophytochrome)
MDNNQLHTLLQKQIEQNQIDFDSTPHLANFIAAVNSSYLQFEVEQASLKQLSKNMFEKISESNNNLRTIIDTLDGFNYHLSHDLKANMINTLSLAKMLHKYLEKCDYSKSKEVTHQLSKNAANGLQLIEKFLEISKLDAKQADSVIEELNIPALIQNLMQDKGIKTSTVKITQVAFEHLMGKRISIYNLFKQLFDNAIRYQCPDRTLEIEIQLFFDEDNRKIITFKDNGVGIDTAENGKYFFKPFARFPENSNNEGTGIGLFLIKKIVTEHKGTVSLKSELFKGTEIKIKF